MAYLWSAFSILCYRMYFQDVNIYISKCTIKNELLNVQNKILYFNIYILKYKVWILDYIIYYGNTNFKGVIEISLLWNAWTELCYIATLMP